jgi:hypothetical protein
MSNKEQNGNFAKPMLPAVFLDGNGIELKKGDKVNMTIYGLGSGIVEVTSKDGELHLWDITQGYYPLSEAVNRKDMFLERLS